MLPTFRGERRDIKIDDSGAKPRVWVPLVHAGILAKIEALQLHTVVAPSRIAGKCIFRPSGVKTPEENTDFMSCLKARPAKLKSFPANYSGGRVLEFTVPRPCRGATKTLLYRPGSRSLITT